jgi:hypothetical protein
MHALERLTVLNRRNYCNSVIAANTVRVGHAQ